MSHKNKKKKVVKKSSTSKSSGKIDYTFNPKTETATQYNSRIAKERGDSSKELASMQAITKANSNSDGSLKRPTETVAQTLAKSQSVLDQTKAQGSTPYAGSTFEADLLKTPAFAPPVPPAQPTLTPEAITGAITESMGTQEQGYQPDMTSQAQGEEQTDEQGNVIPQTASQAGTVVGSQGGQAGVSVPNTSGSIVDYLNASGQPSDFTSRSRMAEQLGIRNYTGTAEQNTQMIGSLRGAPISTQESITPVSAGAITETSNTAPNATAQSYTAVQQKFGLPQTPQDFSSDPIKTIKDITKQVFSAMGLGEANKEIKNISGELEDLENDRDDEIRDINDDPWLTEGVRIRQIQKVEQKYEDRINNRVNRLQLLESVRDDATQQAQFALGTAISLFDQERRFQATQTQMYYDQAQREFDNAVTIQELALKSQGGSDLPNSVQEWMFAVENGETRTYGEWANPVKVAGGGGGGLTPAQINSTVNSIAGAFDNEPIVKSYNTVLGGYNTIKGIGTQTNNPADDISFIYAFAKIMDPDSVVREGEYNTIQKYAQSWATNFGFNAQRIFSNTNFLSSQAKQNMLNTLQPKVNTVTQQYENLYNQYQQQIQGAYSGQPRTITNYAPGNTATSPTVNQSTYTPPQDVFNSIVQGGSSYTSPIGKVWSFLTGT